MLSRREFAVIAVLTVLTVGPAITMARRGPVTRLVVPAGRTNTEPAERSPR